MEPNALTTYLLPGALGVIMLGLGLTLTPADFRRVVQFPRAVVVGLVCQMLLLPAVCFGIAKAMGLPPELAIGLMLLAASPGGATANLFSHLAHGDVALNITLTAVNSVLSLLTLPFIVHFALVQFIGEGRMIPLQFGKVVQMFLVVLIPVAIGMVLRAKNPALAAKLEKRVRLVSGIALGLVILGAVLKERSRILEGLQMIGTASLVFNLASMALGYFVPLAARLPKRQAIAIGMEIGIHNSALAITVASSPLLLNNSVMAIPAAIYSVIMVFTAAGFGWLVNRRAEPAAELSGATPAPRP